MGQVQRAKRLKRELAGKARVKVLVAPVRRLGESFQNLNGALARWLFVISSINSDILTIDEARARLGLSGK